MQNHKNHSSNVIARILIPSELILWPARQNHGKARPYVGSAKYIASPWERNFSNFLVHKNCDMHFEDIEKAVAVFHKDHPFYTDWWQQLLDPFKDHIHFVAQAPHVSLDIFSAWRQITAKLDPDTCITFLLSQRPEGSPEVGTPSTIISRLKKWQYLPELRDRTISTIASEGLFDTHVHFEACDPIPSLWLRLMDRKVRLNSIPRYSLREMEKIRFNTERHEKREREKELISNAISIREWLLHSVQSSATAKIRDQNSMPHPYDGLHQERTLLLACWQNIWALRRLGATEELVELVQNLDWYVLAKSRFLAEHQQFNGSGSGLSRFREFLDRGASLTEAKNEKHSWRKKRLRMERQAILATDCSKTRYVEFRISPRKSVREYIEFFKNWANIEAKFPEKFSNTTFRFVIHFIRSDHDVLKKDERHRFERLRQELDRASAILQRFRHRTAKEPRFQKYSKYIVGIDVANLERACPPDVFCPYLKLLLGQCDCLNWGPQNMRHWQRLKKEGLSSAPENLPPLGLTYHVGEDYHHISDGLRHIDAVVTHILPAYTLGRLGHALALGNDSKQCGSKMYFAIVPKGVILDNLVWVYNACLRNDLLGPTSYRLFEKQIADLSLDIYGALLTPSVLEEMMTLRFEPIYPEGSDRYKGTDARSYLEKEIYNLKIVKKRTEPAPQDAAFLLHDHHKIIKKLQKILARRLEGTPVYIEANPTSNHATGGVSSISQHPIFQWIKWMNSSETISLNTDDPAVFSTRIDYEYAVILDTFINEKNWSRARAGKLLKNFSKAAKASAFNDE